MKYKNIVLGRFIEKKNRLVAICEVEHQKEEVHIKNTGRLKELMVEGYEVALEKVDSLTRKTKYDLISIFHPTLGWVNVDSQANNTIMKEYLETLNLDVLIPEYRYENSRFDFYFEKDHQKYLLEVKGCTKQKDGIGYFPDAPSSRASKHVLELVKASKQGYQVMIAFVIGMNGIRHVEIDECDQEFKKNYEYAIHNEVKVLYMPTLVSQDEYKIKTEGQ